MVALTSVSEARDDRLAVPKAAEEYVTLISDHEDLLASLFLLGLKCCPTGTACTLMSEAYYTCP